MITVATIVEGFGEARQCRWFRKLESDIRGVFEP
jgi:hypothetical protein